MTLESVPVINQQITKTGKEIKKRLEALNIDAMEATDENSSLIKKTKADLNKEIKLYDSQMKMVKDKMLEPYERIFPAYKSEIKDEINKWVDALSNKSIQIDSAKLEKKENELKDYFVELCLSEDVDFITFDKYKEVNNVKILLSTTIKKYREQLNEYIQNVKTNIQLISEQDYEAEILAEYKQSLNCSGAILTVKNRKRLEFEESERLKRSEWNRRVIEIKKLGYEINGDRTEYIHKSGSKVIWSEVADIDKVDFDIVLENIKKDIAIFEANISVNSPDETKIVDVKPVLTPLKAPKEEILQVPTEVKDLEKETVEFRIYDTVENIVKVREFMKANNINYKSI